MSSRNFLYYAFSAVRVLLYPLALTYGGVVWLRNRLYDSGFYSSVTFDVPVISVGNLSVGGTGKTPHIEYLIDLLRYQYVTATMSRGYKRRTQGFLIADEKVNALRIGDEPMQYHMKYPELVVSVAEDRMTGIPSLLQKRPGVEVVLLDDAYQHRSVKAGLNILITDYALPYYKDMILPMGRLREGRAAAGRADVIIVSKCPPSLSVEEANDIRQKINPLSNQKIFFTSISYGKPYTLFDRQFTDLKGKSALIVCGIAKPAPMIEYVEQQATNTHVLTYADHHYFNSADLEEIQETYNNWQADNKVIITTEKDAARMLLFADKLREIQLPVVVLPITISFLFKQGNDFNAQVLKYVADTIAENQNNYGEETI